MIINLINKALDWYARHDNEIVFFTLVGITIFSVGMAIWVYIH